MSDLDAELSSARARLKPGSKVNANKEDSDGQTLDTSSTDIEESLNGELGLDPQSTKAVESVEGSADVTMQDENGSSNDGKPVEEVTSTVGVTDAAVIDLSEEDQGLDSYHSPVEEEADSESAIEDSSQDLKQEIEENRIAQQLSNAENTAVEKTGEISNSGEGEKESANTSGDVSPFSQPPKLPPRDKSSSSSNLVSSSSSPPPLPPRKRTPFFWLRGKSQSVSGSGTLESKSSVRSSADYNLLLQRLDVKNKEWQSRNASERDALRSGVRDLQAHFEQVRQETATPGHDKSLLIDWEFWSMVVSDYANVAQNRPKELAESISRGFPDELRGIIWQLIASSKSATLEEIFESICKEPSPHEKAIKRDLSRTSFIKNASSDSLFRIIKAYSLFDPEVGYTQGMAFITVPLLLNMTEPEAFSLLVSLMKYYELRQFFLPDMPGLHLRLYQFDRLLEDTLPSVHVHLSRQGVRSSMYASQWFLTLFAYKFPLQIVLRIFDIVIAEGSEAILKFGVALMKRNADTIMSLEFDDVLAFLKEKIFDYYNDTANNRSGEDISGEEQYRVNELVADAFDIKILPVTLRKYDNEYSEIHRLERERVEEVESLRGSNGQLTLQVRRLEASLATLNKEHIEVANEMVQGRLEVARLQDENEQLTEELNRYRQMADVDGEEVDIMAIKKENIELKETKERLEAQLNNLERELVDSKVEFESVSIFYDLNGMKG